MRPKQTIENFIKKAKQKHGDRFDYSRTVIGESGNKSIVVITCCEHGEFETSAGNHLTSDNGGCKSCVSNKKSKTRSITQEDYLNRAKLKHGDRFDYSKTVYITNADSVTVICRKHGEFQVNANGHCRLKDGGCTYCSTRTEIGETYFDRFKRLSKIKFGERFDYISLENKIATLVCKKHGQFSVEYAPHFKLINGGCPSCHNGKDVLTENFIKNSIEVHGDLYEYNMVDYQSSSKDVTIVCKQHGPFEQRPDVHIRGFGCPKCSGKHEYTTQEFIEKCMGVHGDKYDYTKTEYINSHGDVTLTCKKHGDFTTKAYYILQGSGCPKCSNQVSEAESDVYRYVSKLTETAKQSIRMLGNNSRNELDIYDDINKIAIEYNGVYWHSSGKKSTDEYLSSKHVNKTNECDKLGIRLYHVFENEWIDDTKKEIWKSVIENAFGKSARLYARKCVIKDVDSKTASDFCENNHLQGGTAIGSIKYGLYHNDELVSLMTFGKARYSDADYELIRFCNKLHTSVVGAGSRLLKHFRKNHIGSIISYANRRWSDGNFYRQLGFNELHVSKPCYFYVKSGKVLHRSGFMKHMLKDKLNKFDENLTEQENMYNNGYRRIWDSGNYVFKLEA